MATTITHTDINWDTKSYRDQSKTVRGLSSCNRRQQIMASVERQFDKMAQYIGRVEFIQLRAETQRNDRKAKRELR